MPMGNRQPSGGQDDVRLDAEADEMAITDAGPDPEHSDPADETDRDEGPVDGPEVPTGDPAEIPDVPEDLTFGPAEVEAGGGPADTEGHDWPAEGEVGE